MRGLKSAFKLVAILMLVILVIGSSDLWRSSAQDNNDSGNDGYKFMISRDGMDIKYEYDKETGKIDKINVIIKAADLQLKVDTHGEKSISPSDAKLNSKDECIDLTYKINNEPENFKLKLKVKKDPGSNWLDIKEVYSDAKMVAPQKDPNQDIYSKNLKFTFKVPGDTTQLFWEIALFLDQKLVENSERLIWVRIPSSDEELFNPQGEWVSSNELRISIELKNEELSKWDKKLYQLSVSISCPNGDTLISTNESNVEFIEERITLDDIKNKCELQGIDDKLKLKINIKFNEPEPPLKFSGLDLDLEIPPPPKGKGGSEGKGTGAPSNASAPPTRDVITTTLPPITITTTTEKIPTEMILLSFAVLGAGIVVMALGVRSYLDAKDYSRGFSGQVITASLMDNPVIRNLKYKPSSLSQLSVDPIGAIVRSLQEYDSRLASDINTISQLQSQLRQKEVEINSLKTQLERYRSHRLDTLMRDLLEKARKLSSYGPQAQSVSTLVNDLYRVYSRDMTGTSKEVEVLRLISSRLDELLSLYQREALKKSQLRDALNQKISAVESQLALMRQKLSSMAQNYHVKLPRSTLKLAETFLERARAKLAQDKFEEAIALTEAAIIVLKELDAQLKNTEYLSMLRILREKFWSV